MKHLVLPLVAALLLAGCTGAATDPGTTSASATTTPPTTSRTPAPPPNTQPPGTMSIHGTVVDPAITPIAGATVRLLERPMEQTTDGSGAFRFDGLPFGSHALSASAPGYMSQVFTVEPDTARSAIRVLLEPQPVDTSYNQTFHFIGHLECALEVLIISPSCDSALVAAGRDPIFRQNFTGYVPVDMGWHTLVADVVFDPEDHPGLAGLRVAVRGTLDAGDSGEYQQYGRFHGDASFTFRVEPGELYPEGDEPVPANTTQFQFDVYPHSHAWHSICVPPGMDPCFLGVGAGLDVSFDLYVTAFYGAPAPEGWSLQG